MNWIRFFFWCIYTTQRNNFYQNIFYFRQFLLSSSSKYKTLWFGRCFTERAFSLNSRKSHVKKFPSNERGIRCPFGSRLIVEPFGFRVPVGFYREAREFSKLLFFLPGKFHTSWKSRERKPSTYVPPSALSKPRVGRPFLYVTSTLALFRKSRTSSRDFKMLDILPFLPSTYTSVYFFLHVCPDYGHIHPYRWNWEKLSEYQDVTCVYGIWDTFFVSN